SSISRAADTIRLRMKNRKTSPMATSSVVEPNMEAPLPAAGRGRTRRAAVDHREALRAPRRTRRDGRHARAEAKLRDLHGADGSRHVRSVWDAGRWRCTNPPSRPTASPPTVSLLFFIVVRWRSIDMANGYLTHRRPGSLSGGGFAAGSLFDLHRQMNRLFDDL